MIPILYRVGIDTMMLSRHVTSLVLNRRRCGQHKTIKTNQEGLVNGRNNTKKKKKTLVSLLVGFVRWMANAKFLVFRSR